MLKHDNIAKFDQSSSLRLAYLNIARSIGDCGEPVVEGEGDPQPFGFARCKASANLRAELARQTLVSAKDVFRSTIACANSS